MSFASPTAVAVPADRRPYLTLRALDQTFALPIEFALSVVNLQAVTRVPRAPAHLVGLANLRGAVVAITSLGRRLDPDARCCRPGGLAVVVAVAAETFALAVDEVGDVIHAAEDEIAPAPAEVEPSRARLVSGVLKSGTLIAPILDPAAVFDFRHGGEMECLPRQPKPGA